MLGDFSLADSEVLGLTGHNRVGGAGADFFLEDLEDEDFVDLVGACAPDCCLLSELVGAALWEPDCRLLSGLVGAALWEPDC